MTGCGRCCTPRCVIENDVNLAAMAERAVGAAAGLDDFAFVWLGVGLGLATVIGGEVRRGIGGAAGEIGWMPVYGAPLPVGNEHPGKAGLQALAGGLAVQALAAEHGFARRHPGRRDRRRVTDLARAPEATAVRAVRPMASEARGPPSSMSSRSGSRSASRRSASSSTPAWSSSAATSARPAARSSPPGWRPRWPGSAWPTPRSCPRRSRTSRCSGARCRRPWCRPGPGCSARSARSQTDRRPARRPAGCRWLPWMTALERQ